MSKSMKTRPLALLARLSVPRTRRVALGLTALVTAGALSACTGPVPTGTAGNAPSKGGTLTALMYINAKSPTVSSWLNACSQQSGFTFQALQVPQGQLINKAVQLTASGDAPALIIPDNNNVATLADAGALQEISLGGLKAEDFVQGPLQAGQYQGKQYAVPIGNNGEVIIYNKTLLKQAGITPPKSWAELTAAAKALKTPNRAGFAQTFAAGETLSWNYWTQLWSNGGSIDDLAGAPAVGAAEFWASFIKNGTAPTASLQWQATDIAANLLKGRVAMGQVGTWTLPDTLKTAKSTGVDIGIIPQVTPDGKPPIIPFGGEELSMGMGAKGDAVKAVNDCIASWSSDPATLATRDEALGYLPSYIPAQAAVLKVSPELQTLADMLKTSRSRTAEVGAKYPAYSTAISTALQKIASGKTSPQDAMNEAASSVK
jgi:multiple sugar transport system substrate-binding protein